MEPLTRDLRDGVRSLRRRPLTTAAAIATLGIGIGLNAAVFSVFDWVLLRPLPFPSPHELVRVFSAGVSPATEPADLTSTEFTALSRASGFRGAAAFSTATRIVAGAGIEPSHVVVARVAGDLFGTLGVYPALGRGFTPAETAAGAPLVVLSDELWRNRFRADEAIAGRTIAIDGRPHTIVGVMPAGKAYPANVDLWRPLTDDEREDDDRENAMIARVVSGTTAKDAGPELATIAGAQSDGARLAWAEDIQRTQVRDVRGALIALLASAALLLLVACANVAALVAAQGADRRSELAVRGALGASRAQLLRQLLIEQCLLGLAGGVTGIMLGRWALDALLATAPAHLPRLHEITLDLRVVIVAMAVTCLTAVAMGLAFALRGSHVDLRDMVTNAAQRNTPRRRGGSLLVAAQTAIAVVLVMTAALLGRSLQNMVATDHGFTPDRLVAVNLYLRGGASGDVRQLYRDLVTAAESTRGIASAAVALRLPTEIAGLRVPIRLNGASTREPQAVTLRPVTPRYFETVGIALTSGRRFSEGDRQQSPRVAIVNRAFERDLLGGANAIETTFTADIAKGAHVIVGVVADVTPAGEPDRPAIYVPLEQLAFVGGSLVVQTIADPRALIPALTANLRTVAPALALDRISLLEETLQSGRAVSRFNAQLAGAFAALALLLAAIGIYGLTAAAVTARWRELGVRLALGAPRTTALWAVMRSSGIAVVLGIAAGVPMALVADRWLAPMLYRVRSTDPLTLATVPLLFVLVGACAALAAVRPALRADPALTLRADR